MTNRQVLIRLLALCLLAITSVAQVDSRDVDCTLRGTIRGLELTESTDLELFSMHENGRVVAGTIRLDGRFTIAFGAPGECALVAIADRRHAVHALDIDLLAGDSTAPLELAWHSPGTLRGVVRLPSGEAAGDVKLMLRLDEESPSRERSSLARLVRATESRYTGLGIKRVEVVADSSGRFVAEGLRPGLWHVTVADRRGDERVSHVLTAEPVALDRAEREFVWNRHQLTVQLEGIPLTRRGIDALREEVHLHRIEKPVGRGWFSPRRAPELPGRGTNPGSVVFDLVAECGYELVWARRTCSPVGRRVRLRANQDALVVALRASPEQPMGRLLLDLPMPANDSGSSLNYRLVHVPTGFTQQSGYVRRLRVLNDAEPDPWDWSSWGTRELSLPEGTYDLTIRESWYRSESTGLICGASYATWRKRIEVAGGEAVEVVAQLRSGARLRLSLTERVGSSSAANRRPESVRSPKGRSVGVTLRNLDGAAETTVTFEYRVTAGGLDRDRIWAANMQLRETCESVILEPGRYLLTARLPDGRESDREIEISPSETLDVTLEFGAEPIVLPFGDL